MQESGKKIARFSRAIFLALWSALPYNSRRPATTHSTENKMLYRVSGKLTDGRPFSSRETANDAAAALTKALEKLTKAKIAASSIAEVRVRPFEAQAEITIGKAKKDK